MTDTASGQDISAYANAEFQTEVTEKADRAIDCLSQFKAQLSGEPVTMASFCELISSERHQGGTTFIVTVKDGEESQVTALHAPDDSVPLSATMQL